MADTGVWVKVHPDDAAPGAAVIGGATADDPLFPVNKSSFEGHASIPGTEPGQAYDVYEFLGSGQLVVDEPGFVDALVVGGGGGGGRGFDTGGYGSGGAGAGGHLYVTGSYLAAGSLTVTVGAGGAATTLQGQVGVNGETSRLGSYFATGGGGAGSYYGFAALGVGGAGGSGGGAGGYLASGGAGTSGLGNDGGSCTAITNGGGGGGSSAVGADGTSTTGGAGGAGTPNSITGSSVSRSGGGGGGATVTGGADSTGGGGAGAGAAANATSGTANTGGGGGGLGNTGTIAGDGGSGVVIVRVRVPSMNYPFRTRTTAPNTAHAARVEDGIVRQVIVIPHLDDDDQKITEYCNRIGLPGSWVDTSYTGSRRGKYAGVGDTFVSTKAGGEFVSPVTEEIEE